MDNQCISLSMENISSNSIGNIQGTDGQFIMGASISENKNPGKHFRTTLSYQHPHKWLGVCQDWTSSTNLAKYNKPKLPKDLQLSAIENFDGDTGKEKLIW